jgi:hypothetical protein
MSNLLNSQRFLHDFQGKKNIENPALSGASSAAAEEQHQAGW